MNFAYGWTLVRARAPSCHIASYRSEDWIMQWLLRTATDHVRERLEPLGYRVRYAEDIMRDRLSVFLSASQAPPKAQVAAAAVIEEFGELQVL